MPTVQEIEIAAVRLRENRRVSVRNVRAVLPRGGSYSDIGPVLAVWKAKTNYRPKELPRDVPTPMATAIEEFAAKLWAVARDEAEKVVEHRMLERAELEREFEKEAAVAWSEVDRLSEEVKDLRSRLRNAGVQVQSAPSFPLPLPRRAPPIAPAVSQGRSDVGRSLAGWRELVSDDISNRQFWDGVLSEVTLVFEASEKEALTAREIFDGLPHQVGAKVSNVEGRGTASWTGRLKGWA